MPNRSPSPTPAPATPIATFTTLRGGAAMELAPGETHDTPIVALHARNATWWTGADATTVALTGPGLVGGSRWVSPGKQLRVGLGTLDVAARSHAVESALTAFADAPIEALAWFPDGARVALLIGPPPPRADRPLPAGRDPTKRELVIAALAGDAPVRRPITVAGTPAIAASADRVIVAGNTTLVFDGAGNPIAGPAGLPDHATRASFGAGRFVVVGADGSVTLVDPRAGSVLATWSLHDTADAVATAHGVVAVDLKGTVRVGCLGGGAIKQVAEASAGSAATRVQVVGDRLVVAADGPDPIRVAAFADPCH